jgi:signal transduction histidine kinase
MIEDLLTLSRIETGTFKTVRERTDVTELVSRAVRAIGSPTNLTLYAHCPPNPLMAELDPHQIERVLTNLLSNAVKFTPAGGEVVVSAREDGDDLVLSISDTGMGIPHEDQPDLFTRFFRASNAVEASIPGTGLGLTIVRNIVTNHDGEVTLRSEPGEGTTVSVRLPRERTLVP